MHNSAVDKVKANMFGWNTFFRLMGADRILILSILLLFISQDLRKVSADKRIPTTTSGRASWRFPSISTLSNADSGAMVHLGIENYERRRIRRGGRRRYLSKTCIDCDEDHAFSSSLVQMMSSSSSETSSSSVALPSKQQVQQSSKESSLWPPWPFNLIITNQSVDQNMDMPKTKGDGEQYHSGAGMFFVYFREKMRVSLRQMQTVGSALSYHLPQSAPPLFALALLPAPTVAEGTSTGVFLSNAHGFCRKLALVSLGIAVLSWADYEVRNTKRLTPLPLDESYKDIKKAISILPPFLPEAVTPIEFDPVLGSSSVGNNESMNIIQTSARDSNNSNSTIATTSSADANNDDSNVNTNVEPSQPESTFQLDTSTVTKSIMNVYNDIQVPGLDSIGHMINGWQKMVRLRQRELAEYKRQRVIDELLYLQQTRKQQKKKAQFSLTEAAKNAAKNAANKVQTRANIHTQDPSSQPRSDDLKQQVAPLGYALVTGASRGIGRALAVELARWQIPLILVARDLDKLTNVADEIEAGYGVNVVCIQADLSDPNAAKQVYEATNNARLHVDILVNNAGICTNGDVVDSGEDEIRNMVNVNVGSVTTLSHLYCKDMKRQRRGRMLFVSSVVGATPGGPGVAAYAATKAYEKSFAMGIGRELEKYGVVSYDTHATSS